MSAFVVWPCISVQPPPGQFLAAHSARNTSCYAVHQCPMKRQGRTWPVDGFEALVLCPQTSKARFKHVQLYTCEATRAGRLTANKDDIRDSVYDRSHVPDGKGQGVVLLWRDHVLAAFKAASLPLT